MELHIKAALIGITLLLLGPDQAMAGTSALLGRRTPTTPPGTTFTSGRLARRSGLRRR
ncbi:MAG: hypothetical protein WC999_15640 [Hydrogenophaga sp.]|jgi:hypothetical protein